MIWRLVLLCSLVAAAGCRQPMGQPHYPVMGSRAFSGGQMDPTLAQYSGQQNSLQQSQNLSQEVQSLNTRLSQFNSDNDNLYAQLASLQQQLEVANNYSKMLKERLTATYSQAQQLQSQNQELQQRLAQQPASPGTGGTTQFAGATLRANNSLMGKLQAVQLAGAKSYMDGDVLRVEIPTDRLFVPGSYQVQAGQQPLLQNLAATLVREFPNQVVGIEAHWDGTPIEPASTSHQQLTATQALAVFNYLVQSGVPKNQLFTMAMGSNRPRYPAGPQNGVQPNRRIEVVIYPETIR